MKIEKLKGNTHWIQSSTNTGVYIFEDGEALLIDVGRCGKRQDNILKALEEMNVRVKYIISTHEHEDHSGGNCDMKARDKDIKIMASKEAKPYMESTDTYFDYIGGARGSYLVKEHMNRMITCSGGVDEVIEVGELEIKGHKFEIFQGRGHTIGSIGVITDDKVGFFGDLLISENSLSKFKFLFIYDYEAQEESLKNIKNLDFEMSVLGHSKYVLNKEETLRLAELNLEALKEQRRFALSRLRNLKTVDELVKDFLDYKKMVYKYVIYLEIKLSLEGLITQLLDEGSIEYRLDDNILKYVAKEV